MIDLYEAKKILDEIFDTPMLCLAGVGMIIGIAALFLIPALGLLFFLFAP